MRKGIVLVSLLAAALMVSGLLSGCEDSLEFPTTTTSSTTTTTGVVSSSLVDTSKGGAMMASSGNNVADVASSGQAASASSVSALNVTAFNGPPSTFFATLTDSDGYVAVQGFHASETVKIRYIMQSGAAVTPSFLATKALAVLGDFDWDSMFTGSSPSAAQVTAFLTTTTHEALATIADYMNWAWTAGLVEQGFRNGGFPIPASTHFTNPTPEAADKVSSMEGVVTLSNDVTGTLNMVITVKSEDEFGMPTGATGSGTLEVGEMTLDATMEVTFDSQGNNETLSVTGTTSDNYTLTMNCIADGSGTGTIKDSEGTTVATMEVTAAGQVTVTDSEGNQSSFTL
jgi:hypothetical protein